MIAVEATMMDRGAERRSGRMPGWGWAVLGLLGFVPVLILAGFLGAHVQESGADPVARLAVFAIPAAYLGLLAWFALRGILRAPVVDGRKRPASAAQIATATMVASLFAGGALGILAGGTEDTEADLLQHPAAFPVLMLVMIFAGWATTVYYRRLDEAALEAHKFAWLWGAQTGLFLATCMAFWTLTRGDDGGSFVDGVLLAVFAAAIGYLVAWGVWWFRKR